MALPTTLQELQDHTVGVINVMLSTRTPDNLMDGRITQVMRELMPKATEEIVTPALESMSTGIRQEHTQMMTKMEAQVDVVKNVVLEQDHKLKNAIQELQVIKAATIQINEQVGARKIEMDSQLLSADVKLDELRVTQTQAMTTLTTHLQNTIAEGRNNFDGHVKQIVTQCEHQLNNIRNDVERIASQAASSGGAPTRSRGLMLPK